MKDVTAAPEVATPKLVCEGKPPPKPRGKKKGGSLAGDGAGGCGSAETAARLGAGTVGSKVTVPEAPPEAMAPG
jgi:hypothetical protein